jgi:lipopolysaccharide biosynthesis glycosyltransferase
MRTFSVQPAATPPLALACGADEGYVLPLAATLHSALSRLRGREVHLYLLDGGLHTSSRARLEGVADRACPGVRVVPVRPGGDTLAGLPAPGHLSTAAYLRLVLPDAVPERWDRIVYLDSDLLVADDPAPLWEMDLQGHPVLAAEDFLVPATAPTGVREGAGAEAPYFNSGVLVMNLPLWRAERIGTRVLEHVRAHAGGNRFADQDGLNAVLGGRAGLLHPRWNVQAHLLGFRAWPDSEFKARMAPLRASLLANPAILHFTGPRKPWLAGAPGHWHLRWLRGLLRSGFLPPGEGARYAARWLASCTARVPALVLRHAARRLMPPRPP